MLLDLKSHNPLLGSSCINSSVQDFNHKHEEVLNTCEKINVDLAPISNPNMGQENKFEFGCLFLPKLGKVAIDVVA
jgi:hypothetical protein